MNNTEKIILDLIRINKKLTNTEITKITGKHKSTISPCIQSLITQKFLNSAGTGSSTKKGGKPPLYLELNPDKLYVIGMSIHPEKLTGIITNFSGKIIQTHYSEYTDKNSTKAVITDITNSIKSLILKESIPEDKISGIGIGIAAQVNSTTGEIYKCEGIKLSKVSLKNEIEKYLPFPVTIINDVNACLLAEKWFIQDPQKQHYDNFMYLYIGSTLKNMGLGLFLNGKLYEGSNHHAGEMYNYLNDKRLKSSLPSEDDLLDFTIDKVKDFLADDNKAVKQLLEIYKDIISEKMINSIELLNPEKLIIGGNVIYAEEEFLSPLIDLINKKIKVFFEDFLQIEVAKSELGEFATPLGATTLVLKEFFE